MDMSAIASAGGGLLNGVIGLIGGERANQATLQNSREADARSAAEAEKLREWQQAMSNSEKQRAKADLKAAGFNPLLAMDNGASTPGGAAGGGTAAKAENTLTPAITSAMEAARLGNEMKMQGEQMKNIQADTLLKGTQSDEAAMRTAVQSKELPKAEIINSAYDVGKQIINKVKGVFDSPLEITPLQKSMHQKALDKSREKNSLKGIFPLPLQNK